MTHAEWSRIEPLATQALALSHAERQALLASASVSEPLRQELLAAYQRIEQSISSVVASAPAPTPLPGGVGGRPPRAPLPVLAAGMPLDDGRDDGRYVVIRQIGRGGMGTVFLAHDTKLGVLVALKVTPDDERLLAEARRAAACSGHRNVATIHDVFRQRIDGRDVGVLVMEYVAGTPASHILDDGPVDPTRALRWARQIAEAIAHAHDHHVLHCDLKPANIIITNEDDAKVLDFGIARATFDASDPAEPLRGTVPYMAPEQLLARQFSPAGDIYSLGVTLFELLTGTLPFDGDDAVLRLRIVAAPPPLLSEIAGERAEMLQLQPILERALAKAPEKRYRSARALKRELDRVYDRSHTETVRIPPPRPITLNDVTIAGAGSLALLTLLGFIASQALDMGLSRTAEFGAESPLWWPVWGARSLFAPAVGVLAPLLVVSVLAPAVCRFIVSTSLGSRWCAPLSRATRALALATSRVSTATLALLLLVAQMTTLGVVIALFADQIRVVFAFMDPDSTTSLRGLSEANAGPREWLRALLSVHVFVFAAVWWQLIRAKAKEIAVPVVAGVAVTVVALFFLTLPYRIVAKNDYERATHAGDTCYVTADRSPRILLFCPVATPRTRVVDVSKDDRLDRSGKIEDLFAVFDAPASSEDN